MSLEDVPLKSLKEVTKYLSRGITPSYTENEGVIVLNQRCIMDNKIDWSNIRLTDPQKKKISSDKYLKQYDVLVNSTGVGTLGRSAQVKKLFSDTTVDSHVTILRPNDLVDPMFFGYAVNMVEKNIESLAEGSTGQTELSRVRLGEEIFINLPPKDIQKKIAKILSYLDEKIELNEKINKNLFSIGRLIFKELILNEYSNNSHSNWVLVPFNEISTVQNGFAFKSNDYCDVGCNMIRTRDITSEGFVFNEDLINLPQSFYESKKYKNYKFERLDTITVMVGASIGKMGLITDINIPSLQNQNMWRFRSKLKNISPAFVYYYVEKINKEIINMATGSARSFYRKNLFLDYECIMPSNDYLNGINPLFNSLFDKISENVAEIDKLTKLRDTLLPKLMSGEIDVSKINCDI